MQDFRNLEVWHDAVEVVRRIYAATGCFPREELYGLTSQMRRSAVSIASNIAEGCGRGHQRDLRRFLHIAMGSASELEAQTVIALELDMLDDTECGVIVESVSVLRRRLNRLIQRVEGTLADGG